MGAFQIVAVEMMSEILLTVKSPGTRHAELVSASHDAETILNMFQESAPSCLFY